MFRRISISIAIIGAVTGAVCAQNFVEDKTPVRMTVTLDVPHGKAMPEVKREDVLVYQGNQRLQVTDWTALTGTHAAAELFILIDDASAMSLGSQLGDLRDFINGQPATTQIGVAYMHNGSAEIMQNLTTDRNKTTQALRLPFGGIAAGASPYLALEDLIKKWPTCCVRREVVMISSGVDPLGGIGPINPYVDFAIEHAQRAGLIVYAIYTPRGGHAGHSFWIANWGQNHLAQLADETGGESYMLGLGSPVTFGPYLREISDNLTHQYSVEFQITSPSKPGFVQVKITSEVSGVEIVAAPKIWVSAGRTPTGEDR